MSSRLLLTAALFGHAGSIIDQFSHKEKPMRLSAIEEPSNPLNQTALVKLDGEVQHHVVTADEEQGYVERYVLDADGDIVIADGAAQTERVNGVVEIDVPQGEA